LWIRNCGIYPQFKIGEYHFKPWLKLAMVKLRAVAPPEIEERLMGSRQLGIRWGEHPKVAYAKALKLGARPIRFNARNVKFRLSEIIRIEEEATAGVEA
jgi:hypothetical protein